MKKNIWLGRAICSKSLETVKSILIEGGDAGSDDQDGQSLVTCAVLNDANDILEYLLTIPTALVRINEQDENLNTPLLIAVLMGNREAVKCLLEADADISIKNAKNEDALKLAERGIAQHGGKDREAILEMLNTHVASKRLLPFCPVM